MNPYDRMINRVAKEKERGDKINELARKAGLTLVQISPRRYMVVETCGWHMFQPGDMKMRVHLSGNVVKQGTWNDCRVYLEDRAALVPVELQRY
jgi:hypothetical protein